MKNGGNLMYTITVNNAGPTLAPDVVVTDALPSEMRFVSSKPSQGTCATPASRTSGVVTCNLGTINIRATARITLVVAANSPDMASVVNTISASAHNLTKNSATVATSVFGPKNK